MSSDLAIRARCNRCDQVKPLTEFHLDRSKLNGHSSTCKPCKTDGYLNRRTSQPKRMGTKQQRKVARQEKVMDLLNQRFDYKQIAEMIGCSVSTVQGDAVEMGMGRRSLGSTKASRSNLGVVDRALEQMFNAAQVIHDGNGPAHEFDPSFVDDETAERWRKQMAAMAKAQTYVRRVLRERKGTEDE